MLFDKVKTGLPDVMYHLKIKADADDNIAKVDLGVGVYRNEQGTYNEMEVLKNAKQTLGALNPSHDYEVTTGDSNYLNHAAELVFGKEAEVLRSGRVASVQTISGTGAVHIGLKLLTRLKISTIAYIGTPTWGNYKPMCDLVGFEVKTYRHYDPDTGEVDFEAVVNAVRNAESGSTFILQGCCHNPTAADFSREQWRALGVEMKSKGLFPFFDIAYQGLGNDPDEDAYGVRHFIDMGFEIMVCQSFSKNFGLYGERVGALHVACGSPTNVDPVKDQLRNLIRWEFSSSPAYGSRLVNIVLSDADMEVAWRAELGAMRERLQRNRKQLSDLLIEKYKTPGNWNCITRGNGLFSMLPLTESQCETLQNGDHIYMVPSGRINVAGLSEKTVDYVAQCIDKVVRQS